MKNLTQEEADIYFIWIPLATLIIAIGMFALALFGAFK